MDNASNSNGSLNNNGARYFKNNLLERMAYTSAFTVNVTFIPIIVYLAFISIKTHTIGQFIMTWCIGLFMWSLAEYMIHRFTFHFKFNNQKLKWFHSIFHLSHHQYPHDKRKYQTLLLLSAPSGVLFYFIFKWIFGGYANSIFTGFASGYVFYEFVHYSVHSMKIDFKWGRYLKQHHMHHHFLNQEKNFGVTSVLWDIIFRTQLTKIDKKTILQKKSSVS
jgi:sterol desaturase/sphingolipid hydroxylase (fatty acid hydroxylase superfamily)